MGKGKHGSRTGVSRGNCRIYLLSICDALFDAYHNSDGTEKFPAPTSSNPALGADPKTRLASVLAAGDFFELERIDADRTGCFVFKSTSHSQTFKSAKMIIANVVLLGGAVNKGETKPGGDEVYRVHRGNTQIKWSLGQQCWQTALCDFAKKRYPDVEPHTDALYAGILRKVMWLFEPVFEQVQASWESKREAEKLPFFEDWSSVPDATNHGNYWPWNGDLENNPVTNALDFGDDFPLCTAEFVHMRNKYSKRSQMWYTGVCERQRQGGGAASDGAQAAQ